MRKRILSFVLGIAFIFGAIALPSCTPKGPGGESIPSDKTVLSVAYYAAGFGTAWMEDLKKRYEAAHPDVYIDLEGDPAIETTVKDRLDTKKPNLADDVVVVGGMYYRYMIRNGYLSDMSDFYTEVVEGTDTVDSIVNQQLKDYLTVNGKTYGIPWQNNGMSFIYNANMFEQYKWEIPETMDEFFALCEQILEDTKGGVHPLTFCGKANQGYFPNVMQTWVAQYEGMANMQTFLNCETAEVYQQQEDARTKVYQTIAKILYGKDSKDRPYIDTSSRGYNHFDAQAEFLAGRSAMVVSGAWTQIEMSEYLVDYPGFKMGIMPVPHINADQKDKDGNDSSGVSTSDAGVMYIPELSDQKELARDFLKFSLTQESLRRFVETTDGLTRPYTLKNPEQCSLNNYFAKTVFDYFTKKQDRRVYMVSKSDIWLANEASMWMCNDGAPVTALQGLTFEQAMKKASELAKEDYTEVRDKWNSWRV